MRFSQRHGYVPVRVELQVEAIDDPLRNKLWSAILKDFVNGADSIAEMVTFRDTVVDLWIEFFRQPLDRVPDTHSGGFTVMLRNWFYDAAWYEVYDLLEAIHPHVFARRRHRFVADINNYLQQELSAYRFVNGEVVPITNEVEVASIEDAMANASSLRPVRIHLESALTKYSDRSAPDYRNSIKESISAVEALCRIMTKRSGATLGEALKRLGDSGVALHPSLVSGWLKLYGFTSDASGIRHALSDQTEIGASEAKYMLVTCSAFVNHVIELAAQADLSLDGRDA